MHNDKKIQSTVTTELDTNPVDKVIGYRLRTAKNVVFQEFQERFEHIGLRPSEYTVLRLIAANPGRQQGEIAAALGITRMNFVALIKSLDKRGLTERKPLVDDRRSNAIFLTEGGREFLKAAQLIQDEIEQFYIEKLGGEVQRDHLIMLLNRLL